VSLFIPKHAIIILLNKPFSLLVVPLLLTLSTHLAAHTDGRRAAGSSKDIFSDKIRDT